MLKTQVIDNQQGNQMELDRKAGEQLKPINVEPPGGFAPKSRCSTRCLQRERQD